MKQGGLVTPRLAKGRGIKGSSNLNEVKDTIRTASKIAEKMGVRQERAGREYGRGQEKVSSNLNEAIAPIKTASKIAEKMGVSEKTFG